MDPVSAVASCITILQLLGTARSLFKTSQHALKNISSITNEVNSLKCILEDLEDQEYKSVRLVQMMVRCESDLNALRERLEKINGSGDGKRRWKWLLVKEDVVEALDRMRGMQGSLLLAMNTSNTAVLREIQEQMSVSNYSQQQHYRDSSTRQQELLSWMNHLALHGDLATSKYLQLEHAGRPRSLTGRWMKKRIYQFILFNILIRANGSRRCRRSTKGDKQLPQASGVLFRFNPSSLLAWLVETAVVVDMTWGDTIGGLRINPRFYVQVPDSHQLIKAARTGSMSLVRNLMSTNAASALCMTSAGWTPLHFAAAKGHLDMCRLLISHGADLNAIGYTGMTPLHAAASFGHTEVMKLLIAKGSDPNIFHDHGFHAIFQLFTTANTLHGAEILATLDWVIRKQEYCEFDVHAMDVLHRNLIQVIIRSNTHASIHCGLQQTRLVNALLTKRPCLDNQDFEGSTALHDATKNGRLDIVEQLMNGLATPTIRDNRGRSSIHYAAELGHVAIGRLLLGEAVTGIDDCDVTGWSPLRLAVKWDHLDTVKLLIDLGAHCGCDTLNDAVKYDAQNSFDFFLAIGVRPDAEVLMSSIYDSNLHYLRNCITGGLSPNSPLGDGWTALTMAVHHERTPALQLLLSMGADVNLCVMNGSSALQIAVQEGNIEMVNILLRAGAVTHGLIFSRESQTVNLINSATQNGYADIAKLLFKAGAPKPAADQLCTNSSLKMHMAAMQNRVDVLKDLIRQGGDVNKANSHNGYTPLFSACDWGSSEAAMLLINAGADLSFQAEFYPPPLFYAAKVGFTDVVELILHKGAHIKQLDFDGRTALLHMLDVNRTFPVDLLDRTGYDQVVWIVKRLISARLDVNVVDKDGHTALGVACWRGLTAVVKLLLEAGADISIPSLENECRRGHKKVFQSNNRIRYLPLELAARAGHEDIVQLLLAKGANWRTLKQGKAIATSHAVLVRHWFADKDDADDEETTFLGCEPPEAQLKVSCAQGFHEPDNANDSRQRELSDKQRRPEKAKNHRQYVIDSGLVMLTVLQWIESCILHLCVGMAAIIGVSLLLLFHKVPFALLQHNWPIFRVLLWGLALAYVIKTLSA